MAHGAQSAAQRHTYAFTVPGPPQPKERPRRGFNGAWYTPRRTVVYERKVALCARAARVRPLDGAVRLEIALYFPDRRRRDADNCAKSIADGLNGIAWADDVQVEALLVCRRFDAQSPRAEITIALIEE